MTEFAAERAEVPRLVYWKIAARGQTPLLMLHAGNVSYEWDDATANAWPQAKNEQPFGQLPVLLHRGNRVAQSGTITRYCAILANLWPRSGKDWFRADMLVEHCNDIYTLMAKAKYSGDVNAQRKAWAELAEKKYPEHLAWLVKMLGTDDYFGGENPNGGDVAVFSVLNMAERARIQCPLSKFPTLLAHSKRVMNMGTIREYLAENWPTYLNVPPEEENTGAPAE